MEKMRQRESTGPEIFRGGVTLGEHLMQIYDSDAVLLDTLAKFAKDGLRAGEGVIVIATAIHLDALESRLAGSGIDLRSAREQDQYIPVDAEERFRRLVFRGWPDDYVFKQSVTKLIVRARGSGRRVRAFGELVSLLWAKGQNAPTVRLEHLWQGVCQKEALSLLCAYPRTGFMHDADTSIEELCALHSRIVAA